MPVCHECHNHIEMPIWSRAFHALICPECRIIIADDMTALAEWMESQEEEM